MSVHSCAFGYLVKFVFCIKVEEWNAAVVVCFSDLVFKYMLLVVLVLYRTFSCLVCSRPYWLTESSFRRPKSTTQAYIKLSLISLGYQRLKSTTLRQQTQRQISADGWYLPLTGLYCSHLHFLLVLGTFCIQSGLYQEKHKPIWTEVGWPRWLFGPHWLLCLYVEDDCHYAFSWKLGGLCIKRLSSAFSLTAESQHINLCQCAGVQSLINCNYVTFAFES